MRIGLDARLAFYDRTGIGQYTRALLTYLPTVSTDQDLYFLFCDRQPFVNPWSDPRLNIVPIPRKQRILWTNFSLPPFLKAKQIDLYHGVCNFELPVRKVCPYVVTIHDLIPLFFPKLVPKKHLLLFHILMRWVARIADKIITDSNSSKKDILDRLGVPEEKIQVIYLAHHPVYRPIPDRNKIESILAKYRLNGKYLLFTGVLEPKKNLLRLIEAFYLLKTQINPHKDLKLVLVGGTGWGYTGAGENLPRLIEQRELKEEVIFTGYVPDEDLPYLYNGAELFVFPSLYEGFGLPVLEAMACGTPVVTSKVSSLPEIVGEAGKLINPYDPRSIAEGISEVLTNQTLRQSMIEKGLQRAHLFSWQRTAAETLAVYRSVTKG
ncbi:MAG TPA: glycosyltransferase family 1 protein [Candidatus Limnocylindrales bacterium]|nr:glycosyltransferase family 1 protein [Candidatus Limnocylindrales bacterium]